MTIISINNESWEVGKATILCADTIGRRMFNDQLWIDRRGAVGIGKGADAIVI